MPSEAKKELKGTNCENRDFMPPPLILGGKVRQTPPSLVPRLKSVHKIKRKTLHRTLKTVKLTRAHVVLLYLPIQNKVFVTELKKVLLVSPCTLFTD